MICFTEIKKVEGWMDTIQPHHKEWKMALLLKQSQELLNLLEVLEITNPCGQKYYLNDRAFLVTYTMKLNLLTFRKKALKVNARILGLPISLSASGILSLDEVSGRRLALEVLNQSKGLFVALNTDYILSNPWQTLSNFEFINSFSTFEEYLKALRADYRRNILKILQEGEVLKYYPLAPGCFNQDHYALYRSVLKRSDYPLETLPLEFFRQYESENIEVRGEHNRLLAVIVLKGTGDTLNFMFCGFQRNDAVSLYQNLLLFVIRKGIEEGYSKIDMGQTSEEAKLRLGCTEVLKYLTLHHSNPLVDAVLRPLVDKFTYQSYGARHRVFR